ncbi:CsiV family protein [Saccharospirillum salsuginis]|nr:CsiV family protein [Saccharospirillum salsuginis]
MTVKTALAAAIIGLAAPLLWAEEEERWYQVELLIFENPDYGTESPEQWPTYPSLSSRTPVITIDEPGTAGEPDDVEVVSPDIDAANRPTPFEPLSPEEQQLMAERTELERTRGFRILYHQAWMQPVPGRNEVIPIRIRGGDQYGQQSELQGYVNLYVERYLHLVTDLQLVRYAQTDNPFRLIDEGESAGPDALEPFPGLSLGEQSPRMQTAGVTQVDNRYYVATESVRLQQRRRMRSTELHYLDNPEFGLLVLITPIEFQDNG